MHLLIDCQALQTPGSRQRGIGRYARNLLHALVAHCPHWRYTLVQGTHLNPCGDGDLPHGLEVANFTPPLPVAPHDMCNGTVNDRFYADWLTARSPDAILILSPVESVAVIPHFEGPRPPVHAVLYDLIPLVLHEHYLQDPTLLTWYAHRFRQLLAVDRLLAISRASAQDFLRLGNGGRAQVTTIGGAPDSGFGPYGPSQLEQVWTPLQKRLKLNRPFLLYVGGYDFRKNLTGTLAGVAALPKAIQEMFDLVIVGEFPESERARLRAESQRLGIGDALVLTGFVSDEELRTLYQQCRLFLFPSLYEGLGLPILEAMRCGAPVVASNTSSLPEYAGPLSWTADPACPQALADAMQQALAEPYETRKVARQQFASAFTWEKVAKQAAAALGRPGLPATPPRKRLAWVSPMPPIESGIADYSADLLAELGSRYTIDIVVDSRQPSVCEELSRNHIVLRPEEAIRCHAARPFDLFIYHIGNNTYHTYMLDLIRRIQGLVVLHDFRLVGLMFDAFHKGILPNLQRDIEHFAGQDLLAEGRTSGPVAMPLVRLDPLNRWLLNTADGMAVHSAWSRSHIQQAANVPVSQIPMPMPLGPMAAPVDKLRLQLDLPLDAFVICSLGCVAPHKRLASLFAAVAALPAELRRKTLIIIVGFLPEDYRQQLHAEAKKLGIHDKLRVLGAVSRGQFYAYPAAADVCVQLRYPTYGETSAALLRAMSAGAACIISDHGPMAELPDHVVRKVRTPEHEVQDLVSILRELASEPAKKTALAKAARQYVEDCHNPAQIANLYSRLIDQTIERRTQGDSNWQELVVQSLQQLDPNNLDGALIERWAKLRRAGQRLAAKAFAD